MSERAQTELVGFLLVFTVVILAIALLGVSGLSSLGAVTDHHRTTNAEQAMSTLATNVDDLSQHGIPTRRTEIGLADASLRAGEPTEVTVSFDDAAADDAVTVSARPIEYRGGDATTIAYEWGAVFREDGDSSVLIHSPALLLTEETLVLPLVQTAVSGNDNVGGTSSVTVQTSRTATEVVRVDREYNDTVTLNVTSQHVTAWERHLTAQPGTTCSSTGPDTVSCETSPDRVVLSITTVELSFR